MVEIKKNCRTDQERNDLLTLVLHDSSIDRTLDYKDSDAEEILGLATPHCENATSLANTLRKADPMSSRGFISASPQDAPSHWKEELDMHPVPPFGINSPVIRHLLTSWTQDQQKLEYVNLWLKVLCANSYNDDKNGGAHQAMPETVPPGLQLVSLRREIKDGFLTLIIPMLRKCHNNCSVHTRREG